MKRLFIKVPSISSYHVIPIDEIKFICPYDGAGVKNKSSIYLKDSKVILHSTAALDEIYDMIDLKQSR